MRQHNQSYERAARRLLLRCTKIMHDGISTIDGTCKEHDVHVFIGKGMYSREQVHYFCVEENTVVAALTYDDKGTHLSANIFAIAKEHRGSGLIYDLMDNVSRFNPSKWHSSGKISTPQMLVVGRKMVEKFLSGEYPPRHLHMVGDPANIANENRITTTAEYDQLITASPGFELFAKQVIV